jgi:hypothetical protein
MVEAKDVINVAQAGVVSPGGIGCATATNGETCNEPTATDSGELDIADPTYSVTAGKTISPSVRYEDDPTSYTLTLTGQPTGTARTQLLTLTDSTPTFWNAFDLASIPTVTLPSPVNQLRLWALTGVDYTLVGSTLTATCAGNTDLTACWHASDWQDADANRHVTPTLPAGISAADVRGVRFEARRLDQGTVVQWERPADPQITVRLAVTRRVLLVHGTNGATDTPVPSTLPGMATAPGETTQGVTSDEVQVDGVAAWRTQSGNAYTGHDADDATTMLRHRVNQIKVEKTPGQGSDSEAPRYDHPLPGDDHQHGRLGHDGPGHHRPDQPRRRLLAARPRFGGLGVQLHRGRHSRHRVRRGSGHSNRGDLDHSAQRIRPEGGRGAAVHREPPLP